MVWQSKEGEEGALNEEEREKMKVRTKLEFT